MLWECGLISLGLGQDLVADIVNTVMYNTRRYISWPADRLSVSKDRISNLELII